MDFSKTSKRLTAVNQEATIWCEGQSKVGISISSMTGTNTLSFFGSLDGLTFNPLGVGAYPSATPPAAVVLTATAIGDFEVGVQNYKFIRIQLTTGSGPVVVVLSASADGRYQEAFITQAILYPSSSSSSGINTVTIAAQANRAINLTFCDICMNGLGFGANGLVRIWDGPVVGGNVLYSEVLTSPVGSVGTVQKLSLPTDTDGHIGISGTPGNAMTIQVVGTGGTTTIINARASMK